ncbi:MAG TPA: serine/threonine-protein kinase [Pyrinomonadaceae bacterium]
MLHCPTCGRHYTDEVKVCPEDGDALQADSTVAAEIPVDPLIGRAFDGKYRLDERLGQGGMGTVYRATHLLIDRPVAIKVLNPRFVEDEEAQERFRREARAAGRLQHMNAVAVTDFGRTDDGFVYIVMELLLGRSLREVLAREAPLDPARAVSIMLQTSAAVNAAHEAGIIHRDLKPGNIFVVQRKHAPPIIKVLDFGIAKLAADALDEDDDPQTLTQVGVMIGTPRYMSPEQCDSRRLTPASDVYSLGIILYELLTGTTPFTGSTPLAVAMKHSTEIPRPPRDFVASIPVELEEVVLHALEKRPEDRPADAGEFRQELYGMAERLGLEHAAGHSAPTLETLRSTATETPSGRLVVDIARLRERRAATSGDALLSASAVNEKILAAEAEAASASPATADLLHTEPTLLSPAKIPNGQKAAWLKWARQPVVLTYIGLAAFVLLVVILAVIAMRSPSTYVSPASHAAGTAVESPAASEVGLPEVAPSASPSPAPAEKETAPKQPSARDRGQGSRRPAPAAKPKQPSKVGKVFGKIKKVFKKPF